MGFRVGDADGADVLGEREGERDGLRDGLDVVGDNVGTVGDNVGTVGDNVGTVGKAVGELVGATYICTIENDVRIPALAEIAALAFPQTLT